jgi:hypothetical protein
MTTCFPANENVPLVACGDIDFDAPDRHPMGLGKLGSGDIIFKRKFRWTMCIAYCADDDGEFTRFVAEDFVKLGARPSLEIEEQEINYLHGKMWIPGKGTWQTISVTYYDVTGESDNVDFNSLFGWIASIYDFICDPSNLFMGSRQKDYEGEARLFLYDGCGWPIEGWKLRHAWPTAINFGELDMSSSEECTVELTLRYSEVEYNNYCLGENAITKCPCSSPCEPDA